MRVVCENRLPPVFVQVGIVALNLIGTPLPVGQPPAKGDATPATAGAAARSAPQPPSRRAPDGLDADTAAQVGTPAPAVVGSASVRAELCKTMPEGVDMDAASQGQKAPMPPAFH